MRVLLGLACVTGWLMACSGSSLPLEGELDVSEVESGWDATHSVLSTVTLDSTTELAIPSRPSAFEHACRDGGTAWVDGEVEVSTDIGSMEATVSFWVHFDECKKNGVVISGVMRYDRGYRLRGGALDVTLTWEGDLVWGGAVEGSCQVRLEGLAESNHTVLGRHLIEVGLGADITGTICGLDAKRDLGWSVE